MILTGDEIAKEAQNGRITISPFTPEQVNPNSYNFRLGPILRVYSEPELDPQRPNAYEEIEIPDEGFVLQPGRLYLAHTVEVLGSKHYAPTFAARSSVARLGLFINLSASLGDIGFEGQWTLQLYTVNRLRVYRDMNIGQMMWWRPQGRIKLYQGKYQGSLGPRSSDIHKDFEKKLAGQRFPGLSTVAPAEQVGQKFAALAGASGSFPVPTAIAVPAGEFRAALTRPARQELAAVFEELQATVGAFFTSAAGRIETSVAGLRLPDTARRLLMARLRDAFPDADSARFAVRSSGLAEDGVTSSFAGVYHSVIDVRGTGAVLAAVEECWRSYYAPPAVAARVRAGDFDPDPRFAVIIQEMIDPSLAGVAFTGLDGAADEVTVEYVEGLAERLVAGSDVPYRASSRTLAGLPGQHAAVIGEVVRLARMVRAWRGRDVDLEWAADDRGVHLLQVRPLTATRLPAAAGSPEFWISRLYFGQPPAGAPLGEVAGVYSGYVAKRGPAYNLAASHGLRVGHGWVVGFTARALSDPARARELAAALAAGPATRCVLDFGETLRQIVVPRDAVVDRVREVAGTGTSAERRAVIVREFIGGRLGVISRWSGRDLIVEYTPEGLLALNRGTAGADSLIVTDGAAARAPASAGPLLPHLGTLAAFTQVMRDKYGDVTLEWVLDGDELVFVDYSVLGGDAVLSTATGVVISAGTASGPVLTLREDEMLRRLSIGPAVSVARSKDVAGYSELARLLERVAGCERPPVVRASRPYAVLSVLIGSVAGFVFDQASALCHLAILLREAGVPAVGATGDGEVPDGSEGLISEGVFSVLTSEAARAAAPSRDREQAGA